MRHLFNWFTTWWSSLQWGDVPGWIESLATGAAFIIVAVTLKMQLGDRRSDQAGNVDYIVWAAEPENMSTLIYQARNKSAPPSEKKWPRRVLGQEAKGYDQLLVTVFNNSKNAINDVKLALPLSQGVVNVGKVPPGEHTCHYRTLDPDAKGEPGYLGALIPLIQFRDQNGRVWQRRARGELIRIRKRKHEVALSSRSAQLTP
jgi:hypothetical protein